MSSDSESSLLVIIIDTNPIWWGQVAKSDTINLTLSQCIDSILVFVNSYLMLSHSNKLSVIASHTNSSVFLYPHESDPPSADPAVTSDSAVTSDPALTSDSKPPSDGMYEHFSLINAEIRDQVTKVILSGCDSSEELHSDSLLAGAMARALCYIHRMEKSSKAGENLTSRVLIIKGSEDNPAQYMDFMNVVFTAQKQNIVIDACIMENESGLLQQACDITGGIYLKVPQSTGLLQYLLWVFLPSVDERSLLVLPPRSQVDYRAACFCHRELTDIGYVCSVCLSIFCSFSPICSTCQTTFRILAPPKMKKKTKVKV